MVIHLNRDFDQARGRGRGQDNIVERLAGGHKVVVAPEFAVEHTPPLDARVAVERTLQLRIQFLDGHRRHESQNAQELIPTRPITYKGQNCVNLSLLGVAVAVGIALVLSPETTWLFPIFTALSLIFGVLLIVPIGGADMPTVIALLNSYAGLSACAMGFVLDNRLLIIAALWTDRPGSSCR